jgi:hypothetical protein
MSGMERAIGGEKVLLRVMEKLHEQIYSQDETIKFLMDKRLKQRQWVGLMDEEIDHAAEQSDNYASFIAGALFAQYRLEEKNT